MTTLNSSSVFAYNRGKQNCYTTSDDQFGKTIFTSPGQAVIVQYTANTTPTGGNITLNDGGTFTLQPNITYQISHRVGVVPSTENDPMAGHILFNTTAQAVIYPGALMGETNTMLFKPDVETTIFLLAFMPDGTPPNTTTQPKTWQYPQQIENSEIAIVAVSGED